MRHKQLSTGYEKALLFLQRTCRGFAERRRERNRWFCRWLQNRSAAKIQKYYRGCVVRRAVAFLQLSRQAARRSKDDDYNAQRLESLAATLCWKKQLCESAAMIIQRR